MVSAIHHKGKRLYELARQGIEIDRPARKVVIKELELLRFELPEIDLRVVCSKGTYVRKLCEDIGKTLGCGGYQSALRRMRIGIYTLEHALPLEDVDEKNIEPLPTERCA